MSLVLKCLALKCLFKEQTSTSWATNHKWWILMITRSFVQSVCKPQVIWHINHYTKDIIINYKMRTTSWKSSFTTAVSLFWWKLWNSKQDFNSFTRTLEFFKVIIVIIVYRNIANFWEPYFLVHDYSMCNYSKKTLLHTFPYLYSSLSW